MAAELLNLVAPRRGTPAELISPGIQRPLQICFQLGDDLLKEAPRRSIPAERCADCHSAVGLRPLPRPSPAYDGERGRRLRSPRDRWRALPPAAIFNTDLLAVHRGGFTGLLASHGIA